MAQQDDLRLINLKLDQIGKDHKESTLKIRDSIGDIKERLFDPDDGLYSRIKDLKQWADKHELEDNEIRKEVLEQSKAQKDRHNEIHDALTQALEKLEPLSLDYKIRVGRKKWIDRLVWIIVTALIGLTLKNFFTLDGLHKGEEIRKSHISSPANIESKK